MRVSVVDADTPIFVACYGLHKAIEDGEISINDEEAQKKRLRSTLGRRLEYIAEMTECDYMLTVVAGTGNFRKAVFTEYKANRPPKPRGIGYCRKHLEDKYDAYPAHGFESDDILAMASPEQVQAWMGLDELPEVVLCHIDKDIDQVPGHHFNFNSGKHYNVSEQEALCNFFTSALKGDSTDNINGLYRLTGVRATKKFKDPLKDMETASEMWAHVCYVYTESCLLKGRDLDDVIEELEITMILLYLLRSENDDWRSLLA